MFTDDGLKKDNSIIIGNKISLFYQCVNNRWTLHRTHLSNTDYFN